MCSIGKNPDGVSLVDELEVLSDVLESAELIADLLNGHSMPNAETASRAPRMLAAVIELAICRVKLLQRVVLEQADVSLLVGRRNKRECVEPGEDADVILPLVRRR